MSALKHTVLSAAAVTALLCIPVKPAAAAGPLLPWALGHAIGAAVRLATLPLAVANSVASLQQPPAQYPPSSGYYGGPPNYYAAPYYYQAAPYYAQPSGYYPAPYPFYRPAPPYAGPMPCYYAPPHGYYAPRASYHGSYAAHVYPRSGGFAYRRR